VIIFHNRVCPIFQISNVTGENLDLLKMFLNLLSIRAHFKKDEPSEFQIDDTYSVPVGWGFVYVNTWFLFCTLPLLCQHVLLFTPKVFMDRQYSILNLFNSCASHCCKCVLLNLQRRMKVRTEDLKAFTNSCLKPKQYSLLFFSRDLRHA